MCKIRNTNSIKRPLILRQLDAFNIAADFTLVQLFIFKSNFS